MHFGCIHGHSCPKEKPVPYNRGCGCLDVSIRLGDGGVVVVGGGGGGGGLAWYPVWNDSISYQAVEHPRSASGHGTRSAHRPLGTGCRYSTVTRLGALRKHRHMLPDREKASWCVAHTHTHVRKQT